MRSWLFCSILVVGVASAASLFAEAREMSAQLAPAMAAHPTMLPHMNADRERLGRHHRHVRGFFPFGFDDGFIDYPAPVSVALEPPGVASALPAPNVFDTDRPPCHEVTGAGVVIDRGLGCRRAR
jgi:hypothetical protein